VDKLFASKGNSFEDAVIRRVSVAAAPMAQWVKANIEFSRVLQRVSPLEAELHKLQASLEESQRLIKLYEEELVQLDGAVSKLKGEFSKKTSEAESLKMSVDKAEATLSAARQLLDGLRGEKGRWETQVGTLGQQLKELPLSSLLAAAFITYLPAYPEEPRQKVVKVTFEAPPGMKKNLQRTYEAWSAEYLASGPPIRAQLLFVLAWFHAVVQERRTYIPQGWTKFYEFSFADLRSGMDVIALATKTGAAPQWPLLLGLLDDAIYGGRLDNTFDSQLLLTFLRRLFNADTVGAAGGKVRPLPGSKVVVPTTSHRADYVSIISALPEVDTPGLFCMPDNIDRTAQQVNSARVIAQLKAMSLRADAAGGFNRQQWQAQLGPLLRLWDQLMSGATALKAAMKDIRARGTTDKGGSPLENFVALERYKGASLVALIDRTLGAIARVLKGTDTLSSGVQTSGTSLIADVVPGG
ncbi:Cytoplasmic dynein 2 heavy chain 1, partial [Tetrabaena socialis]